MSQVSQQAPASQPTAPLPPGPGASPYEWRAYRRRMRYYARSQRRVGGWYGPFGWGFFFAGAIFSVGLYYVLRNSGLIPWFPDDIFWPILLLVFGGLLLVQRATWWRGGA